MSRWKLALVMTVCGLAAACGKGGEGAGKAGSDAAASAGSAGCSAYHAGAGGVVRAFCNGPAKVTVTLDGKTRTLTGGECETTPVFNLNLGVVVGPEAPKPLPDYFGVAKLGTGDTLGDGDVLTMRLDGKSYFFRHKTGAASTKGGHISAEGMQSGGGPVKLEADYTC